MVAMGRRLGVLAAICALLLLIFVVWHSRSAKTAPAPTSATFAEPAAATSGGTDAASTKIYAHNLILRRGPDFRIYVRWLRGNMIPTRREVNPSFDDGESFRLEVKSGVVRANIGDIGKFLNAGGIANSPLKNITVLADGEQIKVKGTLHKVLSLPVELLGGITVSPDNRIQLHVTKLSALKIPVAGLLAGLHVNVSDLVQPKGIAGLEVVGNDIFFDTVKLLPPPHIHGQLAKVRVVSPDIEEVYGNAEETVNKVEQWRNFLRLTGGKLDFGKLTMHNVDLVMVDLSNDAWFDLDLNNYQNQLVNGYTRMTPQAGLQIFMPDLDILAKKGEAPNLSLEWLKNRNLPPPPDIPSK
jgi:hypothetical protein